jgi:hypothetical protein
VGLHVKELQLTMLAGAPIYIARESPERSLLVPLQGAPAPTLDAERLAGLLADAVRPLRVAELRIVDRYEAYYLDRHHEHPLPALFARLNDPAGSMYYVDLKTGRIVQSYQNVSRWNRWLYHGLHSFDLPWLYRHRPAWDVTVLALMLGGTALSVTSVVIAWRRLLRKLRPASANLAHDERHSRAITE